ncbi:MAG: hypothetical protein WB952_02675 [Terriglobales bacterium]
MAEKRTVAMVLKHASRIVSTCLLLTTVCVGVLQAQRSAYDRATQGAPARPKQGFVDYTLKRINPSDKDFGECVDQGRKLIMQESIQNGYLSRPESSAWKTRLVMNECADRSFDIEFRQEQGDEAIFAAAWELVELAEELSHGRKPTLQRTATTLKRISG